MFHILLLTQIATPTSHVTSRVSSLSARTDSQSESEGRCHNLRGSMVGFTTKYKTHHMVSRYAEVERKGRTLACIVALSSCSSLKEQKNLSTCGVPDLSECPQFLCKGERGWTFGREYTSRYRGVHSPRLSSGFFQHSSFDVAYLLKSSQIGRKFAASLILT
ncbi:hypothetical protein AVEN_115928-1 [Araneus ventricosus]|uniref:Uncharacterized protein n=1 Tax=Araneus ventricosus TaxID=182803 RepID=A0A4Y2JNE4_ARAVE|nr:hypothetical protein AVEN_115928-1 [Araneus ventricosus]